MALGVWAGAQEQAPRAGPKAAGRLGKHSIVHGAWSMELRDFTSKGQQDLSYLRAHPPPSTFLFLTHREDWVGPSLVFFGGLGLRPGALVGIRAALLLPIAKVFD